MRPVLAKWVAEIELPLFYIDIYGVKNKASLAPFQWMKHGRHP
jgi:hypothetical protein